MPPAASESETALAPAAAGAPAPEGPPPDLLLEIVLRDPMSGRELALGVMASLRDLEVLGSAGKHYADDYVSPFRPQPQVDIRRGRARRVGDALWDVAVRHCGIEDPTEQTG